MTYQSCSVETSPRCAVCVNVPQMYRTDTKRGAPDEVQLKTHLFFFCHVAQISLIAPFFTLVCGGNLRYIPMCVGRNFQACVEISTELFKELGCGDSQAWLRIDRNKKCVLRLTVWRNNIVGVLSRTLCTVLQRLGCWPANQLAVWTPTLPWCSELPVWTKQQWTYDRTADK